MAIQTDSTAVELPKDPDTSLIMSLYKLVADPAAVAAMDAQFRAGGTGYGDFKKRLFEAVWTQFEEPRRRRVELLENPDFVRQVLREGAQRARAVAQSTLDRVRQAMGQGPL